MHRGYVKLWRKSLESQVWADKNLFRAFICCLLLANYKETWVKVDGLATPIKVDKGQFITGRFAFHKVMYPVKRKSNPNPKTCERWLISLQDMQILSIKTSNKFSLVSILNWEMYQDEVSSKMSHRCPADVQQMSTNKKVKKVKHIKNNILGNYSKELQEAFNDFMDMRRKTLRKPMGDKAIELSLTKLNNIADNDAERIEIINRSIENSWLTFWPLTKGNNNHNNQSVEDGEMYPDASDIVAADKARREAEESER